ncbi:MAG TPA: DUF2059 domain-containing protein [Phenylobacterium sp.]|jgi:hypothetical protein|nr:DUF2059 domain-containing protein [Phenylobacterium sp.]
MQPIRRAIACLAAAAAIVVATPAICADPAPAPSAHSLELAKRLFAEMNMSQLASAMMKSVEPAMLAQARKSNPALTDEQAKAVSEAVSEASNDMMSKLMERMIPLYASTFSEKELQDVVAFYDGPSGRAMLQKMPVLMASMGPIMAELMPQMTADVMRRVCAKTDCSKMRGPPRS